MPEREIRIKLRDYDPSAEMMILEDTRGKLSPLVLSLYDFNRWRIDQHKNSGSRTQIYMDFIKKQGGKQTILKQVEKTKASTYYDGFLNDR